MFVILETAKSCFRHRINSYVSPRTMHLQMLTNSFASDWSAMRKFSRLKGGSTCIQIDCERILGALCCWLHLILSYTDVVCKYCRDFYDRSSPRLLEDAGERSIKLLIPWSNNHACKANPFTGTLLHGVHKTSWHLFNVQSTESFIHEVSQTAGHFKYTCD